MVCAFFSHLSISFSRFYSRHNCCCLIIISLYVSVYVDYQFEAFFSFKSRVHIIWYYFDFEQKARRHRKFVINRHGQTEWKNGWERECEVVLLEKDAKRRTHKKTITITTVTITLCVRSTSDCILLFSASWWGMQHYSHRKITTQFLCCFVFQLRFLLLLFVAIVDTLFQRCVIFISPCIVLYDDDGYWLLLLLFLLFIFNFLLYTHSPCVCIQSYIKPFI